MDVDVEVEAVGNRYRNRRTRRGLPGPGNMKDCLTLLRIGLLLLFIVGIIFWIVCHKQQRGALLCCSPTPPLRGYSLAAEEISNEKEKSAVGASEEKSAVGASEKSAVDASKEKKKSAVAAEEEDSQD